MALTLERPLDGIVMLDAQRISPVGTKRAMREFHREQQPDGVTEPKYLLTARADADRLPGSALAWARLSQAEQSVGNDAAAVAAASRALAADAGPADVGARHAAAAVLLALHRADVLRPLLESDIDALPRQMMLRVALDLGELATVEDLLSEGEDGGSLFVRGWLALEKGAFGEAVQALRQARRVGPVGPALLTNLGYAHAASGRLDKAIRVTREAVALAPLNRVSIFNLAGFLWASGAVGAAITALRSVQNGRQPDVQLALAIAEMQSAGADDSSAFRTLQRVRTSSEWARATQRRRAELEASLTLLKVRLGKMPASEAVSPVFEALKRSNFESLEIASLLTSVAKEPEHTDVLREAIAGLETVHQELDLQELRFHLAAIEQDDEGVLAYGLRWAAAEPLNPVAAALTAHVLCDVAGRYDDAAELGLAAISRSPVHRLLLNNTSYALILAGRLAEAETVLSELEHQTEDDPVALATRSLLELNRGNLPVAIAGYRRAESLAEAAGSDSLAALVRLNAWAATCDIHGCATAVPAVPDGLTVSLGDWVALASQPEMWILRRRILRQIAERSTTARFIAGLPREADLVAGQDSESEA